MTPLENTPAVSVIVLTYNQRGLIGRALEHILAQRVDFDFEIILADDASTDGTREVCRRYAADHPEKIRYIEREENVGVVANYYDCVFRARAPYVADQGGDDYWCDPLKLQKEKDFLDARKDVALVHTAWQEHDEKTGADTAPAVAAVFKALPEVTPGAEMVRRLLSRDVKPLVHMCTAMYRRDAFIRAYEAHPELFGGEETVFEDFQLAVALASEGDVGFLPDVTLSYSRGLPTLSSEENHAKNYRLYNCTLRLSLMMERIYGVEREVTEKSLSELAHYLMTQAWHMRDSEKKRELSRLIDENGIKMRPKTRVLRLMPW